MTKEITKARIIQELEDKFKLREFLSEPFLFGETVVPVYNIEQHLGSRKIRYLEVNITGTGGVLFYTVPDDEKWFVSSYNIIFMGAGAYTVAGMYIARKFAAATFMYLDMTAGQTVSYAVDLPKILILEPGDKMYINIDGYTAPQDLRLYIDVMIEELR